MNLFEEYYKDNYELKNKELSLSGINNALSAVGFSESDLGRIVHVAGTNGKGSTSFFLAQILEKNGLNTALFTSPHIFNVTERISTGLLNIGNDDFDKIFSKYFHIIKHYDLSYFEGVFFIALMFFIRQKPDITILETGLGGRFDATNTSVINNKICLLTSLSQDHTDILGSNIYQIVNEKLAIIRDSSTVFLGINKASITAYIKSMLKNPVIETSLTSFAKNNYPYPFSENYCLAKKVAQYLIKADISDYHDLLLPPCRLERIGNIILDGSHNPSGLLALTKSNILSDSPVIIFTSTKERNIQKNFNILRKLSDKIILTTIPENPRSISEKEAHNLDCMFFKLPTDALQKATEICNGNEILVTGSFYLCSAVKKIIQGEI